MELSQLRYFVTVAHAQHLTRAAEALKISQPALSKAIARLEEELGVELFDRSSNRISLNNNGQLFLQYVQRALLELSSGSDAVRSQAGVIGGSVAIITSCSGLLQPAIRDFLTEYTDIRYQQYRYTSELVAEQLERGSADFAVTTTPLSSAKFSWTRLVRDELYITVSPKHPFYDRESVSIFELQNESLIVSNNLLTTLGIIEDGFAHYGLVPKIDYMLNNPPLTEQLVDNCRGVSFVPGLRADPMPGNSIRRLIPIREPAFSYEVGILKLRNRFQSQSSLLLEQHLMDWFSNPANYTRTSPETRAL